MLEATLVRADQHRPGVKMLNGRSAWSSVAVAVAASLLAAASEAAVNPVMAPPAGQGHSFARSHCEHAGACLYA
jgi:hypothetical protein